jgi:hypothetical protein
MTSPSVAITRAATSTPLVSRALVVLPCWLSLSVPFQRRPQVGLTQRVGRTISTTTRYTVKTRQHHPSSLPWYYHSTRFFSANLSSSHESHSDDVRNGSNEDNQDDEEEEEEEEEEMEDNADEQTKAALQIRNEIIWQKRFMALKAFVATQTHDEQGTLPYPEDRSMRTWLDKQRHLFHLKMQGESSSLTDARSAQLESLGYPLSPRDDWWEKRYEDVRAFVQKHNRFPYDMDDSYMTEEEKRLLWWCRLQKKQYKAWKEQDDDSLTGMNEAREAKLNEIGFCWDAHQASWLARYEELKAYHAHHGDCLVPKDYPTNPPLSKWVSDQRNNMARSRKGIIKVNPERLQLLKELDFEWNALEEFWNRKYKEYAEYVRLHGPGSMPRQKHNPHLRNWLTYQRRQYQLLLNGQKSCMTQKRKDLLDALGFIV